MYLSRPYPWSKITGSEIKKKSMKIKRYKQVILYVISAMTNV